jgi:hypothetical protein
MTEREIIEELLAYTSATLGLLHWAMDHGASADFIDSLQRMRRHAEREARYYLARTAAAARKE